MSEQGVGSHDTHPTTWRMAPQTDDARLGFDHGFAGTAVAGGIRSLDLFDFLPARLFDLVFAGTAAAVVFLFHGLICFGGAVVLTTVAG